MIEADEEELTLTASAQEGLDEVLEVCNDADIPTKGLLERYFRSMTPSTPGTVVIRLNDLDYDGLERLRAALGSHSAEQPLSVIESAMALRRVKRHAPEIESSTNSRFRAVKDDESNVPEGCVLATRLLYACGEEHRIHVHTDDMREEDVSIRCGCGRTNTAHVTNPDTHGDEDDV